MRARPLRLIFFPLVVALTLLRRLLGKILLVVHFPFFLLLTSIKQWVRGAQQRMRTQAFQESRIPKALPKRRPRALTQSDLRSDYQFQHSSPFFAKLPVELRSLIFKDALAAQTTIHLAIWCKTYWHRLCSYHPAARVPGTGYLHACWAEPRIAGDELLHRTGDPLHLFTKAKTSNYLLALPLTCKRIYAETIDLLYRQNTFNVHQAGTIAHLPRSLLPQRLNQIRRLQLDMFVSRRLNYRAPADPDSLCDADLWPLACDVLRNMKGLRSLAVSLTISGRYIWSSPVIHWHVAPLMSIDVEDLEIRLHDVHGRAEITGRGPLPFRVTYSRNETGNYYRVEL